MPCLHLTTQSLRSSLSIYSFPCLCIYIVKCNWCWRRLFRILWPTRRSNQSILKDWWLRWERICLQCRRHGFDPWVGRAPGGGHGKPLQYPCLENPHGQRSLVGYSPWGRKESDTTKQLSTTQYVIYIHFPSCQESPFLSYPTCWALLDLKVHSPFHPLRSFL